MGSLKEGGFWRGQVCLFVRKGPSQAFGKTLPHLQPSRALKTPLPQGHSDFEWEPRVTCTCVHTIPVLSPTTFCCGLATCPPPAPVGRTKDSGVAAAVQSPRLSLGLPVTCSGVGATSSASQEWPSLCGLKLPLIFLHMLVSPPRNPQCLQPPPTSSGVCLPRVPRGTPRPPAAGDLLPTRSQLGQDLFLPMK